ncbi:MAG: AEC family transporter [Pseudomonadota bacterium]
MSPLILVILCLLAGKLLNKVIAKSFASRPDAVATVLNAVVIYVALPAMTITQIHKLDVDASVLIVASGPWLNFLFAAIFWAFAGPALGWGRPVTGMMILATGLGNTSFLGFPLIEALLGKDALPVAAVSDQMGSFLVVSTLGILVANIYGSSRDGNILLRVLRFLPFMATVLGGMTRHIEFHPMISDGLSRLSSLLTPLAVMSVGSRVSFEMADLKKYRAQLMTGIGFKMLLVPALTMFGLRIFEALMGSYQNVMVIEAAMPGMITGYLIGAERGLDARLGALLISVGIVVAMISVPLWARLL